MTTDASITVGIKGDTRGGKRVKRNLDDIRQSSRKTIGTQRRLQTQFQKTHQAASRLKAGIAGAAAALGGFAFAANRSLDTATRIKSLANTAGVGVERFQEFAFVVRQTGGDMSDTAELLKELQNRLVEFAQEGTGPASEVLKNVGISRQQVREAQGNIDEMIQIAVTGFQRLETEAKRTRFLEELLGGQAGERAREFFQRLAREGIEPATQEARRLNQVVGRDIINKADSLNDAFGNLRIAVRNAFATGIVEGFSGEFENFSQAAKDEELKESMRELGKLSGDIAQGFTTAAKVVGDIVEGSKTIFGLQKRQVNTDKLNEGKVVDIVPGNLDERVLELRQLRKQKQQSQKAVVPDFLGLQFDEQDQRKLDALKKSILNRLEERDKLLKQANKPIQVPVPQEQKGLSLTVRKSLSFRDQIANAPGANVPESTISQLAQGGSLIPGAAFEKLPEPFDKAENKASDLKDELRAVRNEVDRFANSTARTFSRFISGTISAQQALQGLLQDLQQFILRKTVTQPLKQGLSSAIGGGFGGLFGGGTSLKSGAVGLASGGGLFNFAQGGSFTVGGRPGVDKNRLSLNGQPVANVSKGEQVSVAPKGQSPSVNVNVINQSGSEVDVQESRRANGQRDIDVLIDQKVAQNIGTAGTKTNRAIKNFSQNGVSRR